MSPSILLVDDDKLLRDVIGEYLSSRGYSVDFADGPKQARLLLETGTYALAMIDQSMKGTGGIALLREIRKQDTRLKCLMMTSYAHLNRIYRCLEDSGTDYIIKPFQLRDLLSAVRKLV